MTDKDQLEQDVIYAVRRLLEEDRRCGRYRSRNEGPFNRSFAKVPLDEFEALAARVKALDAPTPVKPSEVEPGRLFKFFFPDGEDGGLCRMRQFEDGGPPLYEHLDHGPKHMIYRFERGDRIIPIPEGEEE